MFLRSRSLFSRMGVYLEEGGGVMDDQVSLSTRELRENANCQFWNHGLLLLIMGLTSISIISTDDDDGIHLYTHVCTTLNHYYVWVHLEVVKE